MATTTKKTSSTINDKLSALKEAVYAGSLYSVWLTFSIGDFTASFSGKDETHRIISFDYQKTGTEQANLFTLVIGFMCSLSGKTSPDKLEKALVTAAAVNNHECSMQYGYHANNGKNYSSPVYKGQITGYTMDFRDGILQYTLTGYSGVALLKETQVELEDRTGRPTEIVKSVLEEYFKNSNDDYLKLWKVEIDQSVKDAIDAKVEKIPGGSYGNIFNYVSDVLKLAQTMKEQPKKNTSSSTSSNSSTASSSTNKTTADKNKTTKATNTTQNKTTKVSGK